MKVKIYVRNEDPYSGMLRNLLISNNIEYEVCEISRDKALQKELVEVSGQDRTPVIVIDEKAYYGFEPDEIRKIINLAKEQESSSSGSK
ncbi:MAG TPA: glutaredoxin family protein [Candidatus Nanoarchaeia archaeon]|nr:glutaredoxin family protein [Candidatus Nanoarchaeia archaeon]